MISGITRYFLQKSILIDKGMDKIGTEGRTGLNFL